MITAAETEAIARPELEAPPECGGHEDHRERLPAEDSRLLTKPLVGAPVKRKSTIDEASAAMSLLRMLSARTIGGSRSVRNAFVETGVRDAEAIRPPQSPPASHPQLAEEPREGYVEAALPSRAGTASEGEGGPPSSKLGGSVAASSPSKPSGSTLYAPPPRPPMSAAKQVAPLASGYSSRAPPKAAGTRTPLQRRAGGRTPRTRGVGGPSRSGLSSSSQRLPVSGTPARIKGAAAVSSSRPPQQTPRQAAISAKKLAMDQKKKEAALLKQQRQEIKSAAKAKQAEAMAQQQRALRQRADTAQRQRRAAAAAKKAAKEKQSEAQARELQAQMREQKEWQDTLKRQEKERRRASLAYRTDSWFRERELKKKQEAERQREQRMLMDGHNVFREAKEEVKKQQELSDRRELVWRWRRQLVDRSLMEGEGDVKAYEAYQERRDRALDQAALETAAAEESRQRRVSAQWRRNKKVLEAELERGMGRGTVDPLKLADDIHWREINRKEQEEFEQTQKALRRESRLRRRRSDMRRQAVQEAMDERQKEAHADLKASEMDGMKDAAAFREACLRRERASLEGRRRRLFDEKAADEWGRELDKQLEEEERALRELCRKDGQDHAKELEEEWKAYEEYKRQEHKRDRLYKQEEELKRKEQEARERRVLLEDRESVLASRKREGEAEMDRLEALRETPSEKTKLEILEAIWAKQTHPAAAAAARGRQRLRQLHTVQEVDSPVRRDVSISDDASAGGAHSGEDRDINSISGRSTSSGSSTSSGMGIAGRDSDESSFDSLLAEWRERSNTGAGSVATADAMMGEGGDGGRSAIGLVGNVRLDAEDDDGHHHDQEEGVCGVAPAWGDVSAIDGSATATTVTAEAAAVLAAADRSFDTSVESSPADVEKLPPVRHGDRESLSTASDFPVRALVFPEGELVEAPGPGEEEREVADDADDADGSVLAMPGAEARSSVSCLSRGVVSLEDGDRALDTPAAGGRDSSIFEVVSAGQGWIGEYALSSLDANEGSSSGASAPDCGSQDAAVGGRSDGDGGLSVENGACCTGGAATSGKMDGLAPSPSSPLLVAATPITPDDC